MAVDALFHNIYGVVRAIGQQVEDMDVLKDEGRRLYRFVKRTEMLVSEIQPFCQAAGQWAVPTLMLSSLQRLQTLLHDIWSFIDDCCNLGKIPLYMQGDKVMERFQQCCIQLEEAITTLPLNSIGIHEHPEIVQQIKSLDTSLQAAKFDITDKHREALKTYKEACDELAAPFDLVVNACKELLSQVKNGAVLNREDYAEAIADLSRQVKEAQSRTIAPQPPAIPSGSPPAAGNVVRNNSGKLPATTRMTRFRCCMTSIATRSTRWPHTST